MTGIFPSAFKTAKVVSVFKKDSKLDYRNYRSLSLLSNIEKLEFGFRQCSLPHGLINITKDLRKASDDGNIGYGVFINL